jgi:hypothetical protein
MIKFFKAIIVLIGVSVAVFLLWEPHLEGRNVDATPFEVYFNDPFLAYAYAASISFFVILYQAFTLLGNVEQKSIISLHSVKALQTIQYCAIVMGVSIVIGMVWILSVESDDRPPIVAMGTVATLIFVAVATAAAMYGRRVQNALNTKV